MATKKIARVALDVPLHRLFDYRTADAVASDIGRRVLVPFGKRRVVGVLLELHDTSEIAEGRLKDVAAIYRDTPALTAADLELVHFAARYYQHPYGAALLNIFPTRLRRPGTLREEPVYELTDAGRGARATISARAVAQRRLLDHLTECGVATGTQLRALPGGAGALKKLLALAWIAAGARTARHDPPVVAHASGPALNPTPAQAAAIDALTEGLGHYGAYLLQGVTGSGKTEVYLQAMARVLEAGRQVLLLVPEISLTPQLEAMVSARFPGAPLVSLHSGLNETDRSQRWLSAQSGTAAIVLGTRLAVFTPMPRLGFIVVDEEHDTSFKQMDGLRYSARDLAVVRARRLDIPVLLGSATPALESYYNAEAGRYRKLELPARVSAALPRIRCVDTRHIKLDQGLSPAVVAALRQRLADGEQSLVFVNRRGYAPVLTCGACGWLSGCSRCSAQLVLHLQDRRLTCHHCGHQARIPLACPDCGNTDLTPVGHGTQRLEAALAAHLPAARILRIDRDTTRRKDSFNQMRSQIQAREIDILVGTQILAKGHDFPHLGLVVVINADSQLYSGDFRAPEKLFALLTQVAGRAGRGARQGDVLIQTNFPEHPLYGALCRHDTRQFYAELLQEREAAGFPPFVYQALLRAEAPTLARALSFVTDAAAAARSYAGDVMVYDPVPAAMVRLAGRERAQLLVQAASRSSLQRFLERWRDDLAGEKSTVARWAIDVDPLDF